MVDWQHTKSSLTACQHGHMWSYQPSSRSVNLCKSIFHNIWCHALDSTLQYATVHNMDLIFRPVILDDVNKFQKLQKTMLRKTPRKFAVTAPHQGHQIVPSYTINLISQWVSSLWGSNYKSRASFYESI